MSRIRTNLITNRMANGAPTVSNGLVISGVTTSTTFSGSGASLTNLPAAQLTGALPALDGSNLTGITQTTINNNADNRLLTGSGTANTLNAESDITYDGTKLNIASGKYFNTSSPYRVADHPVLGYDSFTDISGGSYATRLGSTGTSTLRSTQIYGGGSHLATFDGVNFRLGLRTTTPAKDLHVYNPSVATVRIETGDSRGQAWDILSTNGAQNNTGTLSFRDESGSSYVEFGANEGSPQFRVRNGGANDLLHVDSSGRVTKPRQPYFKANLSSGVRITGTGDVVFGTAVHNNGNHYNTSNGRFTAPVDGLYWFSCKINAYDRIDFKIRVNGTEVERGQYNTDSDDVGWWSNQLTTITYMTAGQYCNVNISSLNQNTDPGNWCTFMGYLIC